MNYKNKNFLARGRAIAVNRLVIKVQAVSPNSPDIPIF